MATTATKSGESRSLSQKKSNEMQPSVDLVEYAKTYAREKPEVAALWCLGIGFVLGWKLKPW